MLDKRFAAMFAVPRVNNRWLPARAKSTSSASVRTGAPRFMTAAADDRWSPAGRPPFVVFRRTHGADRTWRPGFLLSAGFIQRSSDVSMMRVCAGAGPVPKTCCSVCPCQGREPRAFARRQRRLRRPAVRPRNTLGRSLFRDVDRAVRLHGGGTSHQRRGGGFEEGAFRGMPGGVPALHRWSTQHLSRFATRISIAMLFSSSLKRAGPVIAVAECSTPLEALVAGIAEIARGRPSQAVAKVLIDGRSRTRRPGLPSACCS